MRDYLSGEVLEMELLDQSVSTFLRSLILRDKLPSRKFVQIYISNQQSLTVSLSFLWLLSGSFSLLLPQNCLS